LGRQPRTWADIWLQDAGRLPATVYRAVRSLSRNYGSVWMRQYVHRLSDLWTSLTFHPARPQPEEEQHQLPPLENVP
jgi:hypothetical protein